MLMPPAAPTTSTDASASAAASFNEHECAAWRANPTVNPKTKKAITPTGKVYKTLEAACSAHDAKSKQQHPQQVKKTKNNANVPPPREEAKAEQEEGGEEEVISSLTLLREYRRSSPEEVHVDADTKRKLDVHLDAAIASYQEKTRRLPALRCVEDMLHSPSPSSSLGSFPLRPANLLPYDALKRSTPLRKLTLANCHDGQRKLTVALLEFVADALLRFRCAPEDLMVVYAGASGLASAVASTVFPGIKMALYDPAPNTLAHMPVSYRDKRVYRRSAVLSHDDPVVRGRASESLLIFTDQAGWFNDGVATYCRNVLFPLSGARHLLFTSDVRSTDREGDIARDMRDQMRWTMVIGCDAYMHKFRIPFDANTDDGQGRGRTIAQSYADLSHLPSGAYNVVGAPPPRGRNSTTGDGRGNSSNVSSSSSSASFLYLDGKLHVELYGRQRTTELRLIGYATAEALSSSPSSSLRSNNNNNSNARTRRTTATPGKTYRVRPYAYRVVEDLMTTFNHVYRLHARYAYSSTYAPRAASRVPATYEIVAEHAIVQRCAEALRLYGGRGAEERRIHAKLRAMLQTFSPKTPLLCFLMSADKQMQQMRKKKVLPTNADVAAYAPTFFEWARAVREMYPEAPVPERFLRP